MKNATLSQTLILTACITLLASAVRAQGYWEYTTYMEDSAAVTDDDSVVFPELGSGSAKAEAYKDFLLDMAVTGNPYHLYGISWVGEWILHQNHTTVDVSASWEGVTNMVWVPDPQTWDYGWAAVEAEVWVEGQMHCEDYPASYAFSIVPEVECDLFPKITYAKADYGAFTQPSSFKGGVSGGSSGVSGGLGMSGSSGSFGGAWIPIDIIYPKEGAMGEGSDCLDYLKITGKVKISGKATAGMGWVFPGQINLNMNGGIEYAVSEGVCPY